uniref:Uncharacterized protein n=1 Tax=Candidatus Kentrum sp. DK TaxID=2126562 RepID=A0A450TG87_9GAMM|nr:MAG: hypothetical protein BECKDK2373B_GA0170837_11628 [Candidatus Kentron sp. DK]
MLFGSVRFLDGRNLIFQQCQGAEFRFQLWNRAKLALANPAPGQLGEIGVDRFVLVIKVVRRKIESLISRQ